MRGAAGESLGSTGALGSGRGRTRRLLPFIGPAFVASIAYMDPGNFATNIQGGSRFGYRLLWVVVAANLIGMLVQNLSAKLGVVTGKNLCEVIRDRFPRPVVLGLWVLAEVVAMATDMAELLGAALGFQLLFGFPLWFGALLAGACTWGILTLQGHGFRLVEALIGVLLGVIALCYVVETILGKPDFGAAAASFFPPRLGGTEATLLSTGILGATVMPHVIYLHSALTQGRIETRNVHQQRRLVRFQALDVVIAMTIAGFVNAAMLLMAAATFHTTGNTEVASIEDAHRTLAPVLGSTAATVFGISLLVSGLSSSVVGTMAGQTIMAGFLRRSVPIWVRRVVTMVPAFIVIASGFDPTRALVLSQVVLSFGIPVALVPLVLFTSNSGVMGILRNRRPTTILAGTLAAMISFLNAFLVYQSITG